jgi:hypothetical protein
MSDEKALSSEEMVALWRETKDALDQCKELYEKQETVLNWRTMRLKLISDAYNILIDAFSVLATGCLNLYKEGTPDEGIPKDAMLKKLEEALGIANEAVRLVKKDKIEVGHDKQ